MKKVPLLFLTVILCFSILSGCGGNISSEEAIDIALEELGLSRITTSRTDATLDKSTTPNTYKVVIYQHDHNDVLIINAESGEIISSEVEDANRN